MYIEWSIIFGSIGVVSFILDIMWKRHIKTKIEESFEENKMARKESDEKVRRINDMIFFKYYSLFRKEVINYTIRKESPFLETFLHDQTSLHNITSFSYFGEGIIITKNDMKKLFFYFCNLFIENEMAESKKIFVDDDNMIIEDLIKFMIINELFKEEEVEKKDNIYFFKKIPYTIKQLNIIAEDFINLRDIVFSVFYNN